MADGETRCYLAISSQGDGRYRWSIDIETILSPAIRITCYRFFDSFQEACADGREHAKKFNLTLHGDPRDDTC